MRYWIPRLERLDVAGRRAVTTSAKKNEQRLVPAVVTLGEQGRGPAIVVRFPDGVEVELHEVAHVDADEIVHLVKQLRRVDA